jgi:hypothetical protein
VLIPINTARFRAMGTDRLRSINVLASSEDDIPLRDGGDQKVLRREHGCAPAARTTSTSAISRTF